MALSEKKQEKGIVQRCKHNMETVAIWPRFDPLLRHTFFSPFLLKSLNSPVKGPNMLL